MHQVNSWCLVCPNYEADITPSVSVHDSFDEFKGLEARFKRLKYHFWEVYMILRVACHEKKTIYNVSTTSTYT